MLATAVEAKVAAFIEQYSSLKTDHGHAVVVRNGHLAKRPILTGLGDVYKRQI